MAEISSSNEQQAAASIVKWFQSNGGMTIQGACGVAGNIKKESSFNPQSIGDHGTSAGICQWHNERWDELKNFASSKGLNWNTLEAQLAFIMNDLSAKKFTSLLNLLRTSNSVVESSNKWGHDYERFKGYESYSTPSYSERASYAQAIYDGITTGNWQATDISNVGFGTGVDGNIVQQEQPNAPRPIMASRGQNTVYKLSTASNSISKSSASYRKDKFNAMQESFSKGAPELGRNIILTDGSYNVEILKGQKAKTYRDNK